MHATNDWLGRAAWMTAAIVLAPLSRLAAEESTTQVSQLISPDRQHIAYGQIAVGPNGEQKVRIIVGDADGSHRRALPIDAEAVDEVQWYGNDRIAYVTEHGEDGYQLMDLEGKPAGELRMPPSCDSTFHQCLSPDGKTIAFSGHFAEIDQRFDSDRERRQYLRVHPEIKHTHGLFLVDLATQAVKQVLDETVANLPSWSPDSEFLSCGIGQYTKDYPLAVVERKIGTVHRLTAKGTACGWSPDSKQLAIVTDIVQGGSWLGGIPMDGTIGVLNVANLIESGEERVDRVATPPVHVSSQEPSSRSMSGSYGAVWSPDGVRLAYCHGESSQSAEKGSTKRDEVWIVRSDGSDARKVLNHRAWELAWADERTLLWVNEGQFGRIDIELDGDVSLGPTPEAPASQFTVTGHITDADGQPIEGVEVRAATGMGTLRRSRPVKTDVAGNYELHFGPGMAIGDGGPNFQAATIFARKPGFYERDLCQNGNLGMANYRPKDLEKRGWRFKAIVYRGHPYTLNFVMLPATQVVAELVDSSGEPLAHYSLSLCGKELYPSRGILTSQETDDEGNAEFADVPLKTFWFYLGSREEIRTEPIEFSTPDQIHYRITYDDIAGTLVAEHQ